MNLSVIALIPGFIAFWVALRRGSAAAFVTVAIPALLLLPGNFRFSFQGLPDLSFKQTVLWGVFAVWIFRPAGAWRFSRMDLWVFAMLASAAVSEFLQGSIPDAIAITLDTACASVVPYVLAKGLTERASLRVPTARQIVMLLAIVGLISFYEFRFGVNIFQMSLRGFFPSDQSEWVTQIRWGYARVAGPFSHAILAGTFFAVGLVLFYYLKAQGYLTRSWAVVTRMGVPGPWAPGALLAAGLAMTMSRGPWLAAAFGLVVVFVGRMPNRKKALRMVAALVLLGGLGAGQMLLKYASGQRETATTTEEETAIYRRDLIPAYTPYIEERPYFGWGRVHFPRVQGMPSIDDHYLLITVMQGFVGLGVLLVSLAEAGVTGVSCIRRAATPEERSFAFTLVGGLVTIAISITMVYLGMQLHQLFYILLGWLEGFSEVVGRHRLKADAVLQTATLRLRPRILT